jgi:hypothetical protein
MKKAQPNKTEELEKIESEEILWTESGTPRPPREPFQVYSVRVPADRIEEIRRLAAHRGEQPSVLMRTWVIEKLDQMRVNERASRPGVQFLIRAQQTTTSSTTRGDVLKVVSEAALVGLR